MMNSTKISTYTYLPESQLNKVVSFQIYIPNESEMNIRFEYWTEHNKTYSIVELLDYEQELLYIQVPKFLNAKIPHFEAFLDNQYSIAINTGYLILNESYSRCDLLKAETEVLLKCAQLFNSLALHHQAHYLHPHVVALNLIERIYNKILALSYFFDSI